MQKSRILKRYLTNLLHKLIFIIFTTPCRFTNNVSRSLTIRGFARFFKFLSAFSFRATHFVLFTSVILHGHTADFLSRLVHTSFYKQTIFLRISFSYVVTFICSPFGRPKIKKSMAVRKIVFLFVSSVHNFRDISSGR